MVTLDIDSENEEEIHHIIQEMDYSFSYEDMYTDKQLITRTQITDHTIL